MGRRKSKTKNDAQIEQVSLHSQNDLSDQNLTDVIEENDDDPLAETENNKSNGGGKPGAKKKSPKKRIGQGGSKRKAGKKAKQSKKVEDEQDIEATEEEMDYEVERILDVQYTKSGGREFFIRWKGCGPDSDSWEPEDNLCCADLIAEFIDQQTMPTKKESKKKSIKVANPDEEFEVEKILEVHHKRDGTKEFLIRWKGCSPNEDTWEPEKNLCCPDLIAKFMQKVEKASKFEKREIRTAPKHTERFTLTMNSTGRRVSKRNGNKQRATYYDAE